MLEVNDFKKIIVQEGDKSTSSFLLSQGMSFGENKTLYYILLFSDTMIIIGHDCDHHPRS